MLCSCQVALPPVPKQGQIPENDESLSAEVAGSPQNTMPPLKSVHAPVSLYHAGLTPWLPLHHLPLTLQTSRQKEPYSWTDVSSNLALAGEIPQPPLAPATPSLKQSPATHHPGSIWKLEGCEEASVCQEPEVLCECLWPPPLLWPSSLWAPSWRFVCCGSPIGGAGRQGQVQGL